VFDPLGDRIATVDNSSLDGRNATFTLIAPLGGAYVARVLGADGTRGAHTLRVSGATGAAPAFFVDSTEPADGALEISVPTLRLRFNDQLDLTTFDPSDVLVDGAPAPALEAVVDGATLLVTMPSLADGAHTVEVPQGAFRDLQGTPVDAFSLAFETDATAPRVVASTHAPGDVVPVGGMTFAVTFDEPLAADAIDPSDVVLVGVESGPRAPALFQYDEAASRLVVGYRDLPEDEFTLTLRSGVDGFADPAGNALDGEAGASSFVPTGDGVAGGDLVIDFVTDLRRGLDDERPITVVAVGLGEGGAPSADDLDVWRRKLRAVGDPWLHVRGGVQEAT